MATSRNNTVQIFFKAGYDSSSLGACYQSQRVLMLAELKLKAGVMPTFVKTPVNVSKPPKEFKELGFHLRVPALYLNTSKYFEPLDIADEIVIELEKSYPGGILKNDLEAEAEIVSRDFFSKFCHWMRGVAKDSSHLETELVHIDSHLATVSASVEGIKLYMCGPQPAQIDCEVLPKLHQVRIAAEGIKGYEFPRHLIHLWRYLHSAYSEEAFVTSCPSDTEILLHWLDTGSGKLSLRQQQLIAAAAGRPPTISLTVPATAVPAIVE